MTRSSNNVSTGKTELEVYLEENTLPNSPDFDILGWWKQNGVKYPILSLIAKDILAIPISTVASESSFSTSGRIVGPHRNKLLQVVEFIVLVFGYVEFIVLVFGLAIETQIFSVAIDDDEKLKMSHEMKFAGEAT
ncbi:hypothetical protein LXL04_011504 [Taraxacum kok-saghyz]